MGRRTFSYDWIVIAMVLILSCLGLVTLLSIDSASFYQQLIFAAIGVGAFFVFTRINFSIYSYLDKFIYGVLLTFLLLSFLGPNIRGATRWLELGGVRLQPSELVKPFYILSLSSLLVRYPPTKLRNVGLQMGLFLAVFLVIFRQPDLGNAIIFTSIWIGLLVTSGIPLIYLIMAALGTSLIAPIFYQLLHTYQKLRLLTFLNPLLDPQGAGYNALQSMIAVGSGQWFGRGFGRGTQSLLKFLPERHTDFIFASFSEEFGFLGATALLGLFFILLWRILKQAEHKKGNQYVYLYIVGLFVQIFTHIVIHVGMNVGILPITGITLPFMSAGGSSLIGIGIALGIYMSALNQN